jgi:hypothetical protein
VLRVTSIAFITLLAKKSRKWWQYYESCAKKKLMLITLSATKWFMAIWRKLLQWRPWTCAPERNHVQRIVKQIKHVNKIIFPQSIKSLFVLKQESIAQKALKCVWPNFFFMNVYKLCYGFRINYLLIRWYFFNVAQGRFDMLWEFHTFLSFNN